MEKKFVTLEAFKEYDRKLKEYIDMRDGLEHDNEESCPKCGGNITNGKCENCDTEG